MKATISRDIGTIIFDNIPHGIFTVDKDGIISSFNRAAERITGWTRDEVIGTACRHIFRADRCNRACFLRHSIEEGQQHHDEEVIIRRKDGREVLVAVSTANMTDAAGDLIGGVEMFRDLSLVDTLRRQLHEAWTGDDIISKSGAMRGVKELVALVARSSSTVLVEGEPGTGKELIARAVHNHGPRRDHPFVAVNCGALPDSLAESELFGFKRGAFTDASRDKPGRFALAAGGTLFLDEVGEISPAMQVKLLRVLQEREYMPLGGVAAEPVDVRIIAATNRDLAGEVGYGRFRQDLFFRLNVVRISIPPLRQRLEDLPLLVRHFIDKFNALQGRRISGISERAMGQLMNYDYPGNVRELENAVEHAFVVCGGHIIEREDLPPHILGLQPAPLDIGNLRDPAAIGSGTPAEARADTPSRLNGYGKAPDGARRDLPRVSGSATSSATPASPSRAGPLATAEAETIRAALARTGGHRTRAAEELGISRNTLWRKMKRYGID